MSGPDAADATSAVDTEEFRQMQLSMLKQENASLSRRLDELTFNLHAHEQAHSPHFEQPSMRSTLGGRFSGLYSRPESVGKVPKSRDMLLGFQGNLASCDRGSLSAKLLHLKRLLHRRIDSGTFPTKECLQDFKQMLCRLEYMRTPETHERIRIILSHRVDDDVMSSLKKDIITIVSFTQGLELAEDSVSFEVISDDFLRNCSFLSTPSGLISNSSSSFKFSDDKSVSDSERNPELVRSRSNSLSNSGSESSFTFSVSIAESGGCCEPSTLNYKEAKTYDESSERLRIIIVGLNHEGATASDSPMKLKLATLSELCERDSVAWQQALQNVFPESLTSSLIVSWMSKNVSSGDQDDAATVVCCYDKIGGNSTEISFYYPNHLQNYFRQRGRFCSKTDDSFVRAVLADHIDSICFHEWLDGTSTDSGQQPVVHIPVTMPEWVAMSVLHLSRSNDPWLSFLVSEPHPLMSARSEGHASITIHQGCRPPVEGATATSIILFFELERQQEIIRRKVASLERLMQCKLFVGQMESFTLRLQSHAEELFSGIRIKQETPNTLDALCSQLSSLSMQCEQCIGHAIDAVKAVGDAPIGEEAILQQQLGKILQARNAKQHVDRLKDQVQGALAQKLGKSPSPGRAAMPDGYVPAAPLGSCSKDTDASPRAVLVTSEDKQVVMDMLNQIEQGIQLHKEQQERLIQFWLKQHDVVREELNTLLEMANSAAQAESIGVETLRGRFDQYMEFLEDHERVEDQMLFPLVKALFPQSAEAVDSVLDPTRHKGVEALNARVGRLLQQLHERNRAGEEMVLNTKEMGQVVDALERLNDYMVGHIQYEEEMTMPWLRSGEALTKVGANPVPMVASPS